MKSPLSLSFELPFHEAIAQAKSRGVVLPDVYYRQLPAEARSQAFTVSYLAELDQIQRVLDRLTAHLEDGGTLASFQRWAKDQDFSLSKAHLETVFRNGVQTAYNAGHWRRFESNQSNRPYLMYDAINDGRTRPAHRAMDGIIKPVGDAWWATHSPPCGHRCRCRLVALTREQAEARGGETLNPPSEAQADPGWGSKPTMHLERLKRLEAEKLAKAHPAIAVAVGQIADNGGMETLSPEQKAEFAHWSAAALEDGYRARHEFRLVGYLPAHVLADADVQALNPISDEIEISDHQIRHGRRAAKVAREQAIPVEALMAMPDAIEGARWLFDIEDRNLLAVFDVAGEGRAGKAAIRISHVRGGTEHNAVVTTGLVDDRNLNVKKYREL